MGFLFRISKLLGVLHRKCCSIVFPRSEIVGQQNIINKSKGEFSLYLFFMSIFSHPIRMRISLWSENFVRKYLQHQYVLMSFLKSEMATFNMSGGDFMPFQLVQRFCYGDFFMEIGYFVKFSGRVK